MDGSVLAAWVGAAVALAGAAAALIVGARQLQQMREQTRLQTEALHAASTPYVWADFRVDPAQGWLVHFVLRNDGPTVAQNVRVAVDPPIARTNVSSAFGDLADLPAFRSGMASLPPGREMRWSLGPATEIVATGTLGQHRVTIDFDGPFGPVPRFTYEIDFGDFPGSVHQPTGSLARVEKAINRLTDKIEPNGV